MMNSPFSILITESKVTEYLEKNMLCNSSTYNNLCFSLLQGISQVGSNVFASMEDGAIGTDDQKVVGGDSEAPVVEAVDQVADEAKGICSSQSHNSNLTLDSHHLLTSKG